MKNRNGTFSWLVLILISAIFFLIDGHHIHRTIQKRSSIESAVTQAEEGNLIRRISFSSLGVFGVIGILKKKRKPISVIGFLSLIIMFFVFWSFLSLSWADDSYLTIRRLMTFAMLCLGALAVSTYFSLRQVVLWVFFSTTLFLMIGLLAEIFLGTFQPFSFAYRFGGTLHPNSQGINCALVLISGFVASQIEKRGRKLYLLGAFIGLFFLYETGSRTAFVSAIVALLIFWSLTITRPRKVIIFLCMSLAFGLILLLFGDALLPVAKKAILLGRGDNSAATLSSRTLMWQECFKDIESRPFQGYGYGGFWTPRRITEISAVEAWGVTSAHSAYLEIILNIGIIGLLTYIIIFYSGIKRALALYKISSNSAYVFLGILLLFCFLDGFLESATVNPTFVSFLSIVALAYLGFRKAPERKLVFENKKA